jgi:heme exporter protein D
MVDRREASHGHILTARAVPRSVPCFLFKAFGAFVNVAIVVTFLLVERLVVHGYRRRVMTNDGAEADARNAETREAVRRTDTGNLSYARTVSNGDFARPVPP